MSTQNYGTKITQCILLWCPSCGRDHEFGPGNVDDNGFEVRPSNEDGCNQHLRETPWFWVPLADADLPYADARG